METKHSDSPTLVLEGYIWCDEKGCSIDFNVQLHFGHRGKEGNRELMPDSFCILTNENGLKYVTMSFNEQTKKITRTLERNKESRRCFMFQQTGNPLCPVASLEKYLSLLPSNPPASYIHPKRQNLSKCVWYVDHAATHKSY